MIVVADTSPLNYLILIEQVKILEALYGQVIVPPAVQDELLSSDGGWPTLPFSAFNQPQTPGCPILRALREEWNVNRSGGRADAGQIKLKNQPPPSHSVLLCGNYQGA
jgi:hypothetical protein